MKKSRILVSALLVLAMLLSCVPAFAAGAEEPMKLTCYIGTGTAEPQDQPNNEYVKWIQQKFNLDISETQFLTGTVQEQLGLMIAGDAMPDIVCCWSDASTKKIAHQFAEAGMLVEVEEMLRNSPNLMADLNETFIDEFREEDGSLYIIPSYGINPENTEAQYTSEPNLTFFKRTDLFEKYGLDNPATPDDLYNALITLSETQTVDGSAFIPLQAGDFSFYEVMIGGMFGIWNHRTDINEAEKRFTQYHEFPEYVDFLKYMAKLYREGLVDPELFVTEQSVAVSRHREARVGIGITWPNDLDILEIAAKNIDPETRYNAFPIPKADGVEKTNYMQTNTFPSMITLISSKCEDPDRAMQYLDWQASTEGWLAMCYGAPGKGLGCWYEEDGQYYYDQARRDEYSSADPLYENQVLGGWTYFMVGRYIYHINHQGFANVTESPDAQRMEAREYNLPEAFIDPEWELVQNIPAGEVEEVKSIAVNKVLADSYFKIVMEAQNDDEVETMYADMMENANAAGLRSILEERYARYQMYLNGEL